MYVSNSYDRNELTLDFVIYCLVEEIAITAYVFILIVDFITVVMITVMTSNAD